MELKEILSVIEQIKKRLFLLEKKVAELEAGGTTNG